MVISKCKPNIRKSSLHTQPALKRKGASVRQKMTKYEKKCSKYWLVELENRRLTLLASTIRNDLSNFRINSPAVDRLYERVEKRMLVDNPLLRPQAYLDFDNINYEIANNLVCVNVDMDILANARLFLVRALEKYTRAHTNEIQCNLNMTLLLTNWKYGPGASIGCEETHFVDKISMNRVSCTERARPLFALLRKLNPFCNNYDNVAGIEIDEVRGSTLSTVPKNKDTHRTICTEPLGNMALQLAAGRYIEGALLQCGINLADQQVKNRRLACSGSKNNALCTIDLKSASDYITPALIKLLWPTEWYHLLMTIRSPEYENPDSSVFRKLHMMSTMGNGFTFPMMTLTLLSLIYGFNAVNGIGKVNHIDLNLHAVFGDDIICPSSSFEGICNVLSSAGLKVNEAKSYADGPFRESCGGDYYNGGFITPFYIESTNSDSEIYVAINKVLSWCSFNEVSLPNTLKSLRGMLRRRPLLVPEWDSPDSGVLTMDAPHRYRRLVPIRKRIDVAVQDEQLLSLIILGGYVETRSDGSMYYTRRVPQGTTARYIVEDSRYSKSYRDASDPSLRSPQQSTYVRRLISAYVQ